VAFVGRGLPAHSCATAPVSHRIPLVPAGILTLVKGRFESCAAHTNLGLAFHNSNITGTPRDGARS
jgi:hypothetical protein